MADVFISYHMASAGEKSTGQLVPKIATVLENLGIICWYAERDLKNYSGSFPSAITREIRDCKIFLLILSQESNQSENVKNEVSLAFQRIREKEDMKPVYFKIDNCVLSEDMAYYLSRFQITDGSPPDAPHIKKLVEQITHILSVEMQKTENRSKSGQSPKEKPIFKIVDSGMCGKTVMYTLDETGMLTISGFGSMRDFYDPKTNSQTPPPWWDKREMISRVRIKDGVTNISGCAFLDCSKLIGAYIPESVTTIGISAFHSCALISVYLPLNVTTIKNGAFANCPNLTDILVNPKNRAYNSLEGTLFNKDMSSLICYPAGKKNERFTIPNSVTNIGAGAFWGCSNLSYIFIPNSVKTIEASAFYGCSIKKVHIPNSVTNIGMYAFYKCAELHKVHIPDSVTNIGEDAFYGTKLERVSVPVKAKMESESIFPATTAIRFKMTGLSDLLIDILIGLVESLLKFLTSLSKHR